MLEARDSEGLKSSKLKAPEVSRTQRRVRDPECLILLGSSHMTNGSLILPSLARPRYQPVSFPLLDAKKMPQSRLWTPFPTAWVCTWLLGL